MPSKRLEKLQQQRSYRLAESKQRPSSAACLKRREAKTASDHKSRVAKRLLDAIMCDSGRDKHQLDARIRATLSKYSSLVNHEYRKCMPTFNGMPSLFSEMQKRHPQKLLKDARSKGISGCRIAHFQTLRSGKQVSFVRINGYDSCNRRQWPNYCRSLYTTACAFDRTDVVRMLVVDFKIGLETRSQEDGLELVNEHGGVREWAMTGFDLAIEFGSLATFDLLRGLADTYPGITSGIQYSKMPYADLRAICERNQKNRLTSCFDAEFLAISLELDTANSNKCKCTFCDGNK